jgi:hypothetical protein
LLLIATLSVGVNAAAQCSKINPDAKPVVSITLAPIQGTVNVGSPLIVRVTMTNRSDHDISFWNSAKGYYKVEVRDKNDELPKETKTGFARNGHANTEDIARQDLHALDDSGACVPLKPGQTWVDNVDVSKRYDINQTGDYSIYVATEDPENSHLVKSNTITVTVAP